MGKALNISEACSIAIHAMALLSCAREGMLTNKEISKRLNVSENHLSKVLQRLSRAGMVGAVRGPRGGFRLGKPARDITLLDIYEAIEGPIERSACLFGKPVCEGGECILGDLVENVNQELHDRLASTRLSDLGDAFPR